MQPAQCRGCTVVGKTSKNTCSSVVAARCVAPTLAGLATWFISINYNRPGVQKVSYKTLPRSRDHKKSPGFGKAFVETVTLFAFLCNLATL